MVDIEQSNYLTDLAARIRITHAAVGHAMKSAVENAMATGDLLLEAKEQLDHGQWMPWLREHCQVAERTARLYMRLAKNRAVIELAGDTANLTLNGAARLLAAPRDEEEKSDDDAVEVAAATAAAKMSVIKFARWLAIGDGKYSNEKEWWAWFDQQFQDAPNPKAQERSDARWDLIFKLAGEIDWDSVDWESIDEEIDKKRRAEGLAPLPRP
jgi:Protein of unknown function (DUF3102)